METIQELHHNTTQDSAIIQDNNTTITMRTYTTSNHYHHHHHSRSSCNSCHRRCHRTRHNHNHNRHKRLLKDLSHSERLDLVHYYTNLGRGCIVLGFIVLLLSLLALTPKLSWDRLEDREVAVCAGVVGIGLGSALMLIFAESSRNFRYARQIESIDGELLETWTVYTDEEDDDNDNNNEDDNKNDNATDFDNGVFEFDFDCAEELV